MQENPVGGIAFDWRGLLPIACSSKQCQNENRYPNPLAHINSPVQNERSTTGGWDR